MFAFPIAFVVVIVCRVFYRFTGGGARRVFPFDLHFFVTFHSLGDLGLLRRSSFGDMGHFTDMLRRLQLHRWRMIVGRIRGCVFIAVRVRVTFRGHFVVRIRARAMTSAGVLLQIRTMGRLVLTDGRSATFSTARAFHRDGVVVPGSVPFRGTEYAGRWIA